MHIFLDTARVEEIALLAKTGLIDGVTTNPSLLAQVGHSPFSVLSKICEIIKGPVSAEVAHSSSKDMVIEARKMKSIAPNIVIKVPVTSEGLQACRILRQEGILVNVTLCFSANQALLAAKAGATYISPFIGRIDDHGGEGIALLHDIRTIYDHFSECSTQILAASIRHPIHVTKAALAGCECITIPPHLFQLLYMHPLTTQGLEIFERDIKKQDAQ